VFISLWILAFFPLFTPGLSCCFQDGAIASVGEIKEVVHTILVKKAISAPVTSHAWQDAELVTKLPTKGINFVVSVAFSPQGNLLASNDSGGKIVLRDSETFEEIKVLDGDGNGKQSNALLFTSDGRRLISAGLGRKINFFDAGTGKLVREFREDPLIFWHLSLSSDDCILAASSSNGLENHDVKVWNLCTRKPAVEIPDRNLGIVSPDGQFLFVMDSSRNNIDRVQLDNNAQSKSFLKHPKPIHAVAISPDGEMLAGGDENGIITLWSLKTGQVLRRMESSSLAESRSVDLEASQIDPPEYNPIRALVFHPDNLTLASADTRGNIILWSRNHGEAIKVLRDGAGTVFSIAFSPDGQTLVSGGTGYSVKVWR
jgi:WD40 repeat protein